MKARSLGRQTGCPWKRSCVRADGPSACARRSCGCGESGESTFTNTSTHGGICSSIQIAGAGGKAPGNLSLQISNASFIEWTIPGKDWPLAGTHRGHAGLADVLQKASEEVEMTYPEPPEFVAQGDRVLVVGVATGKIKATNRAFKDDWVFAITVRNGKVTKIREY